jgi:hypothetical protein
MGKALNAKLNPDLDAGMRRNRRRALGIVSYLLGRMMAAATVLFGAVGLDSNLNGLVFGGIVVVLVWSCLCNIGVYQTISDEG